jgi:TolB-like protein/DNA-binding winged helix-turn-helix (wHTH) protein/Tfp pilus assembly protein PilF
VLYHFGSFTLDTRTWELLEDGKATRLPPQPVRALALLVSRTGDLVSREELREHLWPGTFVEFDQGLNSCIRRIRRVLKDDADTPLYVETLPGRGYRFIASVTRADTGSPELVPQLQRSGRWIAVAAALVLVVGTILSASWSQGFGGKGNGKRVKLAVIPFENLDADSRNEYLRAGLLDELIAQLGSLDPARLGVIARTSAMRFDGNRDGVAAIGAGLGVDYLLVGSLRGAGDSVRIVTQLVSVKDETHLWAQAYDRERKDLLDLELEVARRVARSLMPTLLPGAQAAVTAPAVLPPHLHLRYLKAKYFLTRGGADGPQASITLLENLAREVPDYAPILSDLALAYVRVRRYEDGRRAAAQVVAADSADAAAHLLLANIALRVDWDPAAAEQHHQVALRLAPHNPGVNHSYAVQLATRGDMNGAARYLQLALDVDPISPSVNADLGWLFYRAGRYRRAVEQCGTTLELVPESQAAVSCLLHANSQLGRIQEARGWAVRQMRSQGAGAEVLASVEGPTPDAGLLHYFQWRVASLKGDSTSSFYDRALALADAERDEEALCALEESLGRREHDLIFLGGERRFSSLHGHERFRQILARLRAMQSAAGEP